MQRFIPLILLTMLLTACFDGFSATSTQTFAQPATPQVTMSTFNGTVVGSVSTDGLVHATVVKHSNASSTAAAEKNLADITISFSVVDGGLELVARRTSEANPNDDLGADITFSAPATASLTLVASNGGIHVTNTGVTTSAQTSNGDISLTGGTGAIIATTSNGNITLQPLTAVLANAHTSNGTISWSGALATGENAFITSNGDVAMTLPSSSSFALDASTSNGNIQCSFPISAQTSSGTELQGQVGSDAETRLTAQTQNGSITIKSQ